jgi:hypothetical protein
MATIRIWNPFGGRNNREEVSTLAHRKYKVKHHHHRRRRNPFGFTGSDGSRILWGTVGGVAARAVPAMVLPSQNSGWMGYALNLGTALALKLVLSGEIGDSLFVGGAISTAMRVVSDNLGAKIQGLSGDPGFTLGAYWQSYFAVPTVSDPYGRVAASPYPQPPPVVQTMKGYAGAAGARSAGGRFSGRFGM